MSHVKLSPLQLAKDYTPCKQTLAMNRDGVIVKYGKSKEIKLDKKKTRNHAMQEMSEKAGMSPSYFATMQKSQPVQFRYLRILGRGDLLEGNNVFKSLKEETLIEIQKIIIDAKNNRKIKFLSTITSISEKTLHTWKDNTEVRFFSTFKDMRKFIKSVKILGY